MFMSFMPILFGVFWHGFNKIHVENDCFFIDFALHVNLNKSIEIIVSFFLRFFLINNYIGSNEMLFESTENYVDSKNNHLTIDHS